MHSTFKFPTSARRAGCYGIDQLRMTVHQLWLPLPGWSEQVSHCEISHTSAENPVASVACAVAAAGHAVKMTTLQ